MVLSNQEIIKKIKAGEIFIGSDEKTPHEIESLKFDTASLDIKLAPEIYCWNDVKENVVDPCAEGFSYKEFAKKHTDIKSCTEGYVIKPGEFVLASTAEYIKLPKDICARVQGRSSLGRLGLSIHVTAPTIHSASEGNITLEVFNHSQFDLKMTAGMYICQLIFEEIGGEIVMRDDRTFHRQTKPTGHN